MSGPEDFVSFGDYLGLNDEAGQAMLKRAQGDYKGPSLESLQKQSDSRWDNAGIDSESEYQRRGESIRSGLASYSEFMGALNDPAKRQALLEKTYGKGAASQFDATLTGGASTAAYDAAKTSINSKAIDSDRKRADYAASEKQWQAGQAADQQRRQANYDASQAAAKKRAADAEDQRLLAREDMARAQASGMNYQQYRAKRMAARPDTAGYLNETRADDASKRYGFDRSLLDVGRWWDTQQGNGGDWTESRRDRLKRQLGQEQQQNGKTWGYTNNSGWGFK